MFVIYLNQLSCVCVLFIHKSIFSYLPPISLVLRCNILKQARPPSLFPLVPVVVEVRLIVYLFRLLRVKIVKLFPIMFSTKKKSKENNRTTKKHLDMVYLVVGVFCFCISPLDSPSPAVVAGVMDTSCTSAMSSLQMMVDSQYRVMAESAVGTLAGPGIGGGTSTAMVESTVVRLQPSHTNNNNPATAMELIEQLRAKEAEIQRIQMRLVSSCGTGSLPSLSSDRVSILSCVHGDVVLLAYDDNHENYVIFMLGPLLHFLHRDSLEELRLSTDRERSTKRWIIGEVVDKEYCEARRVSMDSRCIHHNLIF